MGNKAREDHRRYQREYRAQVMTITRPGHEGCDRSACCAQGRRNYNRQKMREYRQRQPEGERDEQ